jgi:hypothetical protein
MYQNLYEIGQNHTFTDDKKYSCLSVPYAKVSKFLPYQNTDPSFYQREYFEFDASISDVNPLVENKRKKYSLFQDPEGNDSDSTNYNPIELFPSLTKVPQNKTPILTTSSSDSSHKDDDYLLPVLDCRFNLREICKQCILLEDHLSHNKKRCHDCCIKHFLAIEGLAEEAITLDKKNEFKHILEKIPDKIRNIEKFWYQDTHANAHKASQMLREIRKEFMQNTFHMIFEKENKEGSCNGGLCKIKK